MAETTFVPEADEIVDLPALSEDSSLDVVLKTLALGTASAVPMTSAQVKTHGVGWATKTADAIETMCIAQGMTKAGREARLLIWAGVVHNTLSGVSAVEAYDYTKKLLVGKDGTRVLLNLIAKGKQAVDDAIYDKEDAAEKRAEFRKQINATATMALLRVETELEFIERGVYGSDVAKVKKLIERLEASIRD